MSNFMQIYLTMWMKYINSLKKKNKLPKWIKVERESMNNLLNIREIVSILKNLFIKENLNYMSFTVNSTYLLKKKCCQSSKNSSRE